MNPADRPASRPGIFLLSSFPEVMRTGELKGRFVGARCSVLHPSTVSIPALLSLLQCFIQRRSSMMQRSVMTQPGWRNSSRGGLISKPKTM